jgi:hypothetical protein
MKKELRQRLQKLLDDTEERLEDVAELVAALIARRAAHNYVCPSCEERFTEQEAGANKGECPAGCDAFLVRDDLRLPGGPRVVNDPEGAEDRWLAAKDDDAHDDDPETDDGETFTPAEARRRRIALPDDASLRGPRVVDEDEAEVQPGVASKRPARRPDYNPPPSDLQRGVRKSGGRLDGARFDQLRRPTRKNSSDAFPKARRGGSRFI